MGFLFFGTHCILIDVDPGWEKFAFFILATGGAMSCESSLECKIEAKL